VVNLWPHLCLEVFFNKDMLVTKRQPKNGLTYLVTTRDFLFLEYLFNFLLKFQYRYHTGITSSLVIWNPETKLHTQNFEISKFKATSIQIPSFFCNLCVQFAIHTCAFLPLFDVPFLGIIHTVFQFLQILRIV
jgi:hypothetical protein